MWHYCKGLNKKNLVHNSLLVEEPPDVRTGAFGGGGVEIAAKMLLFQCHGGFSMPMHVNIPCFDYFSELCF